MVWLRDSRVKGKQRMRELVVGSGRIHVLSGSVTKVGRRVGAIVNAANEELRPGGGVCGAIHAAGGMAIAVECRWIGGAETGTAVATTAGNLDADIVIHAVGPVWRGGRFDEDRLLASAYRASLNLAAAQNLTSIAFPSLSTGIYGFPIDRAAPIAIGTAAAFLKSESSVTEIIFAMYGADEFDVFVQCADRWERLQAGRVAQEQRAG